MWYSGIVLQGHLSNVIFVLTEGTGSPRRPPSTAGTDLDRPLAPFHLLISRYGVTNLLSGVHNPLKDEKELHHHLLSFLFLLHHSKWKMCSAWFELFISNILPSERKNMKCWWQSVSGGWEEGHTFWGWQMIEATATRLCFHSNAFLIESIRSELFHGHINVNLHKLITGTLLRTSLRRAILLDLSSWLQWSARAPCEIRQVPWSWLHQPRRDPGNHAIHPHFIKQRGGSQMWRKAIQNYSEWSWEMIEHKLISPQVAITEWVHHQLFYLLSIQYVAECVRLQFKGAVCFYATGRLSKPLLTMF